MKKIYVCGPTVYSDVHIGNVRPILTFDIYLRSLKYLNIPYEFIHNITDIDDKIIHRAKLEGKTEYEISSKYTKKYFEILKSLNIIKPTHTPSVTENISGIILFIEKLIQKNSAYIKNGNVYFSVMSNSIYGTVSNRNLDEMIYENHPDKNHPADFAIWKKTSEGISFESPWGKGRPGWHTECAFFVSNFSSESLDIHGGGIDLLFPHHENENIQFHSLFGNNITKEWRHVGHINVENEKMSKSAGNVINAKNFIDENGPDILRVIFLTTGIKNPIYVNDKLLSNSKNVLSKFYKSFISSQLILGSKSLLEFQVDFESDLVEEIAISISKFDFSDANKKINKIIKNFNYDPSVENSKLIFSIMKMIGFNFTNKKISIEDVENFQRWKKLREDKKFNEADILRETLIKKGII